MNSPVLNPWARRPDLRSVGGDAHRVQRSPVFIANHTLYPARRVVLDTVGGALVTTAKTVISTTGSLIRAEFAPEIALGESPSGFRGNAMRRRCKSGRL